MKTLEILLFLTLVHLLLHTSTGLISGLGRDQFSCCPSFKRRIFHKETVLHARMTDGHCRIKALIVTTKLNENYCIDPNMPWSKKILAAKQMKRNVTVTVNYTTASDRAVSVL